LIHRNSLWCQQNDADNVPTPEYPQFELGALERIFIRENPWCCTVCKPAPTEGPENRYSEECRTVVLKLCLTFRTALFRYIAVHRLHVFAHASHCRTFSDVVSLRNHAVVPVKHGLKFLSTASGRKKGAARDNPAHLGQLTRQHQPWYNLYSGYVFLIEYTRP
jgi:hypothetical protein